MHPNRKWTVVWCICCVHWLADGARAAVDLDQTNPAVNNSLTYATEIAIDESGGTTLSDDSVFGSDPQNLTASLGFTVNAGDTRFVRIDLGGTATFANDPALIAPDTGVLASGGAGESFAILQFTADANRSSGDLMMIDVDGITVTSQEDVVATYGLFENATAAASGGTALAVATQTAYRFAPALVAQAKEANSFSIDVSANSTRFVDSNQAPHAASRIARVKLDAAGNILWTDSRSATMSDLVTATTSLIVQGDFSAVSRTGNGELDTSKVQLNNTPADSLTEDRAVFLTAVGSRNFPDGSEAVVTMTVTGTDRIAEGSYTGEYLATPAEEASLSDVELGKLSELSKNGSSALVNLVLTPESEGGIYPNFVRISNTSGESGLVFLELVNDEGMSVTFELGDVSGQATVLGANSSTGPISNDALMQAARTIDPEFTLGLGNRNKLRLTVDGEFRAMMVDNIGMSRDKQRIFTFE